MLHDGSARGGAGSGAAVKKKTILANNVFEFSIKVMPVGRRRFSVGPKRKMDDRMVQRGIWKLDNLERVGANDEVVAVLPLGDTSGALLTAAACV